jgi:hypothetical protein
MHCLSLVYWITTPAHVLGVSTAHHQEVECIYMANGTFTAKLTVSGPGWNGNAQQVPFAKNIHSTSWWWAVGMPETCRGVIMQ